MKDYRDEKQQVFKGQTYSTWKKQAILQKVHHNKKNRFLWKPTLAIIAVFTIAILLMQNIIFTKTTTQSYTENSMEQTFYNEYANDKIPSEVLYVELGKFKENDGFLITKEETTEGPLYVFYYGQFENDHWSIENSTVFSPYIEDFNNAFELLRIYDNYESENFSVLYVGALSKETMPDKIIVGEKTVDTIYNEKDLPPFWIEQVQSEATPVYFVTNNTRKNVKISTHYVIESLPVIEDSPTDIIFSGSTDMLGAYDTYSDYDLLVDPQAFNNYNPDNGDVVLLKNGKLARILVTDKNGDLPLEVTISEGAVLLNGYFRIDPYMSSHNQGFNTIYDRSPNRTYFVNDKQYFAKADNWGNIDAFEGIITKDDILGKVKGYSLMSVQLNIPIEVAKAYADFKNNYDYQTISYLTPEKIAILQKYAEYLEDYKTVYELYAKSSINLTSEQFLNQIKIDHSNIFKQQLLYEIDLLVRGGSFNEQNGELKHIHPITNETKLQMFMAEENGGWKVKYGTRENLN